MLTFVSTYEGFGLPILESQATGRPVVTSNVSSMPEVAGDAACLVNPYDADSIREGILRVINDDAYRKDLMGEKVWQMSQNINLPLLLKNMLSFIDRSITKINLINRQKVNSVKKIYTFISDTVFYLTLINLTAHNQCSKGYNKDSLSEINDLLCSH